MPGTPARGIRVVFSSSGGSFKNDFPAPAFLDPVLALFHRVVQVVALVFLLEGGDDHVVHARISEKGDLVRAHLDPLFRVVDALFTVYPTGEVKAVRAELLRIIARVALVVAAFP